MDKYFDDTRKSFEETIPPVDSDEFKRMRNLIRKQLRKKENEFLLLVRSLKVIIFGDWHTDKQRERLREIKHMLLKNGIYAQTINDYYDIQKRGGLSPPQILETCCINHQLIVFLDGEGPGTVTEQNYLADNYAFQGKTIFFISESKFDKLKDNPNEYIRIFPTIITYSESALLEKILVYTRFRMYRLAEIIIRQTKSGRGLRNPAYQPWRERLKRQRDKNINA